MDVAKLYFEDVVGVKKLIVEGLSVGDVVPNWEDYELLNP